MKATHFRVSYEGDWNGHRYFYEEEVEAKEYQMKNAFWLKLLPNYKREAIEALNNANAGDRFEWRYQGDKMVVQGLRRSPT